MVDAVVNIVNRAFGRAFKAPLQLTDYDSSFERTALGARNEFAYGYNRLVDLKQEDFKTFIDTTTTAGVNEYTLTFETTQIAGIEMWLIDSTGRGDYPLIYYPEDFIKRQYNGDLSDVESGKPYGWFIKTTAVANQKKLAFLLAPDDIYQVRGYYYQEPTALAGSSLTACNRLGDVYLEDHTYSWLLFTNGLIDEGEKDRMRSRSLQRYICQDFKVNTRADYSAPHQHNSGNGGFVKFRNGMVIA
jgi:hypothetical protein